MNCQEFRNLKGFLIPKKQTKTNNNNNKKTTTKQNQRKNPKHLK